MEQQQTKLPLEWLSSRRTPELHRLEQLCRETAREHRCAQRRLQEVEEVMASTLVSPWLFTTAAAILLRRSSFIRSSLPEEVILQSVMASSLKVMVTVTVL